MTAHEVRKILADDSRSHDGDIRLAAQAIKCYADGADDDEVIEVVLDAIRGFHCYLVALESEVRERQPT